MIPWFHEHSQWNYRLTQADDAYAWRIAAIRDGCHAVRPDRSVSESLAANYRGMCGEIAFRELYKNLKIDEERRPGGDGGVDFIVEINGVPTTIDIKTALSPLFLLVQKSKLSQCAHWVVLFGYDPNDGPYGSVDFMGWESRDIMAREDIRKFDLVNYHRYHDQLRRKDKLDALMRKRTYEQTNHRDATAASSGSLRDGQTQTLQVPVRW